MNQDGLVAYLSDEREKTIAALQQYLVEYEQVTMDLPLGELGSYMGSYLLSGGKMARPTLTRLGYRASEGSSRGNLVLGSAGVEVFHRFILAHDDIIDQDMQRHNLPTFEAIFCQRQKDHPPAHPLAQFARGMAIVAGDLMHSMALDIIRRARFEDHVTLEVLAGFHSCLVYTAAGWKLETELKQKRIGEVAADEIKQAMLLVSAHYSVLWPLRFGQLFAGKKAYLPWLEDYGESVGIGFQIRDDLLGIFGDSTQTGKPVGNDLREGKKTLLLWYAYQEATDTERADLETAMGTTDAKLVRRVQKIFTKTKAVEYAQTEAMKQVEQAIRQMPDDQEELQSLAEYLISRSR